jgi:uncharacterized protein (TIGR02145 family)
MNKILLTVSLIYTLISCSEQAGTPTITDTRDGNVYKTVVIGTQTWMAENLNATTFRNGDIILEVKTRKDWVKAGENKQPAWCFYDNNPENGVKYGRLYNWYAVNDPRGLAPIGWHIPNEKEWETLLLHLGGHIAGKKMKSNWGCNYFDIGNNESGFSGLPGGHRSKHGIFYGNSATWWSSSNGPLSYTTSKNIDHFITGGEDENDGNSIRCIRD